MKHSEINFELSNREKNILGLMTQGKCRKNIASELNLSIHTIDTHLRHLHLKTNTHSPVELIIWAIKHHQTL